MDPSVDQTHQRDTTPASPSPGRVTFERWVTHEDAGADFIGMARLN